MTTVARKPTTWRIDEDTLAELDKLAKAIDVSRTDIVQLALEVAITKLTKASSEGKKRFDALSELHSIKDD